MAECWLHPGYHPTECAMCWSGKPPTRSEAIAQEIARRLPVTARIDLDELERLFRLHIDETSVLTRDDLLDALDDAFPALLAAVRAAEKMRERIDGYISLDLQQALDEYDAAASVFSDS